MLRSASLKIIRALGIEGGCNVQLALAPNPETTPVAGAAGERPAAVLRDRGQPARLAQLRARQQGDRLPDRARRREDRRRPHARRDPERRHAARRRPRSSRRSTTCVVKIPRWPFDKFPFGDRALGTQMKATGEVMAIDRTLRGRAAEGGALAGDRRPLAALGRCRRGRTATKSGRMHATDERLWSIMAARAPRRRPDGALAADRHRPLVPQQARQHRLDGEAPAGASR